MAQAANPTSKSRIGTVFQAQLATLTQYVATASQAFRGAAIPTWYAPAVPVGIEWSGNPLAQQELTALFSRAEQGEQWAAAVGDGNNPGTVGDVISLQTQGDWLQMLERAYRSRHMTSVRAKCHAAARDRGHGAPRGVLQSGTLGFVQHLDKQAKS